MFDLKIERNDKGDFLDKVEKTPEQLAEIEFKNQVFENVFRALENKSKEKNADSETESFDSDDSLEEREGEAENKGYVKNWRKDIRDRYIRQKTYF